MKEALKLALEAADGLKDVTRRVNELIAENKALKAALAQPAQQEPVAWMDIDEKGSASGLRYWSEPDNRHEVALYTTPQQRPWVGLTDEEIDDIYWQHTNHSGNYEVPIWPYERAIEAKLKEKNT